MFFTGYQGVQTSPDTVAKVGDEKISYQEFKRVLDQQIQFFSYQFGGKSLTSKQINDFQLKPRALEQLVNQKLFLKLSEHLAITPSKDEVVSEIKKIPAFLTNEKFDVNKYKNLLKANGLTPSKFEEQVGKTLKIKKLRSSISKYPMSSSLVSELNDIQKNSQLVKIVNVPKSKLYKFINISDKEIKTFLKDEKNNKRVSAYFTNNKESKYDQKEQVKASHILIKGTTEESKKKADELRKKVNVKNFKSLANKNSEDPGNQKKKGGELGWFSKGRMVPEFENAAFSAKKGSISQPVKTSYGYHIIYVQDKKQATEAKLADYEKEIAKSFIQKESVEKINAINAKVIKEIKASLSNESKLKTLLKKYELSPATTKELNILSDYATTNISNKDLDTLLSKKDGEIEVLRGPLESKVVLINKRKQKESSLEKIKTKYEQKFLNEELQARLKSLRKFTQQKVFE